MQGTESFSVSLSVNSVNSVNSGVKIRGQGQDA